MLESRAERSALGAPPDIALVDFGLIFLSPKPNYRITRVKKQMTLAPSPHKKPVSIVHE